MTVWLVTTIIIFCVGLKGREQCVCDAINNYTLCLITQ